MGEVMTRRTAVDIAKSLKPDDVALLNYVNLRFNIRFHVDDTSEEAFYAIGKNKERSTRDEITEDLGKSGFSQARSPLMQRMAFERLEALSGLGLVKIVHDGQGRELTGGKIEITQGGMAVLGARADLYPEEGKRQEMLPGVLAALERLS